MSEQGAEIVGRNFVLKRKGDLLYLPCTKEISCKAPPHLANQPYILCKTAGFDEASRRLSLHAPTDYSRWDENAYLISTETNSSVILSFDVQTFDIPYGFLNAANLPRTFDWGDLHNAKDWEPKPLKKEPALKYAEKASSTPRSHRISINEKWRVPIEDILFENGKASFTRFVYPTLGDTTFEIHHPAIRKEFDAIKGYFEKILRSKTIECHVTLEASDNVIQSKTARFGQDDLINGAMIEKVEDYIIEKEMLNSDEAISIIEEKLKIVIGLDEKDRNLGWLLDKLSTFKKSKHYDHLRHLSSLHDATAFRLRMTGKPVSFIFALRGSLDHYLVWETYETEEATYIWKLQGRNTQNRRKEVADLVSRIQWLRAKNKITYLQSNPSNFWRIEHDYSQEDRGLEKWKAMLSAYLT